MTKQDYYEECVGITSNLCSLIAGMINQRPTLKLGRNLESFSIPDERAFTLSFTLSDQELKGKMGSAYPTNIIDDFVAVSVSYDDATKTYNVRQTFRFGKARQSPAGHKNDFTPLAVKTMTEFWATSMGYKITHRYDSDGIYRISVVEKEDSFVLSQNDDGRKNLILQMLDNIKANILDNKDYEKIKAIAQACRQSFISQAPVLVVVCSDSKNAEIMYGKRAEKYVRQHAGAAIENFLLKITNMGLASCWIGAFSDETVRNVLEIPENIEIEAIFPIAYPSKAKARLGK